MAPATGQGMPTARSTSELLVSIIVNNYNYGRFLCDAVESALNQSYRHTEVLVVDDGSTDCSRDIIASYGNRIKPFFKENGGQASAFNVGFAHSCGDIIIFLDSDDMLFPYTVEKVVSVFHTRPLAAKVQFRLELMEADGAPTGMYIPPAELPMPNGDLRKHTLHFPDDIRTPPTSGNAFAASTLRQILPIPIPKSAHARANADLYLHNLVPLFGRVESLGLAGGLYRTHGLNHHYTSSLDLGNIRRMIVQTQMNRKYIQCYASSLQLPDAPRRGSDILSVTLLINRIASLRLEPERHPVQGDTKFRLFRFGAKASFRRFDLPKRTRLLYVLWFLLAIYAPKTVTRWLVTKAFYPEHRGLLGRLAR